MRSVLSRPSLAILAAACLSTCSLLLACSDDSGGDGSSSGESTSGGTSGASGGTSGASGGTSGASGSSGTSGASGSSGTSGASGSSGTSGSSGASGSSGTSGSSGSSGASSSSGAVPSHTDGAKNVGETDIDCGGNMADAVGQAPRCADNKACEAGTDCANAFCNPTTKKCATPTSSDGFQNGTETDTDCGGPGAGVPRCIDTKKCVAGTDCVSKVCDPVAKTCSAPTGTDGVQNGDESDVDCGGSTTGAPKCATGKTCNVGDDCSSFGCNDLKKCAAGHSCTQQYGGRTCGSGEVGQGGAQHEDCCTRIPITGGPNGNFSVDKYLITAGRMRSFVEAVSGKVRNYIATNTPAWWNAAWTPYLPNSWDGTEDLGGGNFGVPPGEHINIYSTYAQLAGGIIHDQPANQGCWIGAGANQSYGAPTYLVPRDQHMKNGRMTGGAVDIYGDAYVHWQTQNQLDTLPLNCTNWSMFAALCAWDGGQLISQPEYDFIVDVDGTGGVSTYPWGQRGAGTAEAGGFRDCAGQWRQVGPATSGFTCNACPACELDWINWSYNYQYPNPPANNPYDQSFFISAPGRFPKGASRMFNANPAHRVQDIAGLMIESTRTTNGNANFSLTFGNEDPTDDRTANLPRIVWRGGSWEGHGVGGSYTTQFTVVTKYGKMGSRCVY